MECYIKDYPRPQFVRNNWENLNGEWDFAFDDEDRGEAELWHEAFPGEQKIQVPFTYETKQSGIQDEKHHPNVWYHRKIQVDREKLKNNKYILQFEGSDFITKVWVNGKFVGVHRGGYVRFSFDLTRLVKDGENDLVVKVEDSCDIQQPRGKQRWQEKSYACFYVQTTGIWKTVWSEYEPKTSLQYVKMTPDMEKACLELEFDVDAADDQLGKELIVEAEVSFAGRLVNQIATVVPARHIKTKIDLADPLANVCEWGVKVWTPANPHLYDIHFRLWRRKPNEDGIQEELLDEIGSYFAMREIRIVGDRIHLNRRTLYQRLVLNQGYWKDSHMTPPDEEALLEDVNRVKALGYNGLRIHQKVEDERFLYWCDVKGLLVWCEMASAYQYTDYAVREFAEEWMEVVRLQYNHPCVITWVPFNESWGINEVYDARPQQHFTEAIYHLTKSFDPYRPVVVNDGWEHTVSDIINLHDYEYDGALLKERYSLHKEEILEGKIAHNFHRTAFAKGYAYKGQPIIMSEYGGISDKKRYAEKYDELTTVLKELPYLSGYCYTQLYDVQEE